MRFLKGFLEEDVSDFIVFACERDPPPLIDIVGPCGLFGAAGVIPRFWVLALTKPSVGVRPGTTGERPTEYIVYNLASTFSKISGALFATPSWQKVPEGWFRRR